MIYFYCTKCHKKIEAVEDWAGASCSCPSCGTELVIPNTSEEEKETPIAVMEEEPVAKPIEEKPKQQANEKDMVIVNANSFVKSCFVVLLIYFVYWFAKMAYCGYFGYTCDIEEIQTLWGKAFHRELGRFPYMMCLAITYYFIKHFFTILIGIYENTKKA